MKNETTSNTPSAHKPLTEDEVVGTIFGREITFGELHHTMWDLIEPNETADDTALRNPVFALYYYAGNVSQTELRSCMKALFKSLEAISFDPVTGIPVTTHFLSDDDIAKVQALAHDRLVGSDKLTRRGLTCLMSASALGVDYFQSDDAARIINQHPSLAEHIPFFANLSQFGQRMEVFGVCASLSIMASYLIARHFSQASENPVLIKQTEAVMFQEFEAGLRHLAHSLRATEANRSTWISQIEAEKSKSSSPDAPEAPTSPSAER